MNEKLIAESIAFELSVLMNVFTLLLYLKVIHRQQMIFLSLILVQVIAVLSSVAWIINYWDHWWDNVVLISAQSLNTLTSIIILFVIGYKKKSSYGVSANSRAVAV